jgi:hypothetical protein
VQSERAHVHVLAPVPVLSMVAVVVVVCRSRATRSENGCSVMWACSPQVAATLMFALRGDFAGGVVCCSNELVDNVEAPVPEYFRAVEFSGNAAPLASACKCTKSRAGEDLPSPGVLYEALCFPFSGGHTTVTLRVGSACVSLPVHHEVL